MKLDNFPVVETLVEARAGYVRMREHGRVRLEIDGRMVDPPFAEALKPAIKVILNSRIDEIDHQLLELGVEVG